MDLRSWLFAPTAEFCVGLLDTAPVKYVGRYVLKRLFSDWTEFCSLTLTLLCARVVTYCVIGHEYVVLTVCLRQ